MFRFINQILNRWKKFKQNVKEKYSFIGKSLETIETLLIALIVALILREFIIQSSLVFSGSMIPTLKHNSQNQLLKSDRLIVNKLVYHFNEPKRGDIVLFQSPNFNLNRNYFIHFQQNQKSYIRRLIGLPGDTIQIENGDVFVNETRFDPSDPRITPDNSTLTKQRIPENHYFFLNDNRTDKNDSRTWGPIPKYQISNFQNKQFVKRLIGLPGETVEIKNGQVFINNQQLEITGINILKDQSNLTKTQIPHNHYFVLGDNRSNSQDSRFWGFVPKEELIGEALFIYWPIHRIRWLK